MENKIQEKLSAFITECQYEQIPPELITDMKYRIIDWLGCAVTAVHYPQIEIARQLFVDIGGAKEATIIGAPDKYPTANAAMINGMIGHVSELDDGHRKAIGHPGSVTLPVALALTEKYQQSITGQDFLKALILGYDLFIRLGQTVNPSHYKYWHTTGTCGVFAATATAASLMKLTPTQTCHALGIAATLASGLVISFGTHAKAMNIGHACQNAINAAMLAQKGFTGSFDAITGEKGFIKATSQSNDFSIFTDLNEKLLCSDTAFYKVYASCGHTNSPLDLLFQMKKNYPIDYQDISRIDVQTYQISVGLTGTLKTSNEDQAKFSLPYCLAIALIYGVVSLEQFKPEVLANPEVLALGKKVFVTESAQATARFPKRQANMTITMKDGTQYSNQALDSSDEIEFETIEKKFLSAAHGIGEEQNNTLLSYIKTMDQAISITPIFDYIKHL